MSFSNALIGTTTEYKGVLYMKIPEVIWKDYYGVQHIRNAVILSGGGQGILVRWTEEGGFQEPNVYYIHPWHHRSWRGGWFKLRYRIARPVIRIYELYKNRDFYKRIMLTMVE